MGVSQTLSVIIQIKLYSFREITVQNHNAYVLRDANPVNYIVQTYPTFSLRIYVLIQFSPMPALYGTISHSLKNRQFQLAFLADAITLICPPPPPYPTDQFVTANCNSLKQRMRKKDQKIMRMKERVNVRLRGSELLFSIL